MCKNKILKNTKDPHDMLEFQCYYIELFVTDYKSDSEIYTEPKSANKKGKAEGKTMEKMKKIHLDEK